MPEGDTVWRATKRLHQALAGQELKRTDFRVPSLATTDLSGQTVVEVVPRGKHLLMRLSNGVTIHSHLRMEGSWHLYRAGERWRGGPTHQIRVVLETAPWTAVGYRLSVLDVLPTDAEDTVVGHLGPDLLAPDFDLATAIANLERDPDRTISEALLDQRNLAGIGNIYRNEICFLLGLHPWRPVRTVDAVAAVDLARRLMKSNLMRAAQVTTGVDRPGQRTWVSDRAGRPCRRCGTTIESAPIGEPPRDRISYWCPACQPPVNRGNSPPE
jgi:endonuclease-8